MKNPGRILLTRIHYEYRYCYKLLETLFLENKKICVSPCLNQLLSIRIQYKNKEKTFFSTFMRFCDSFSFIASVSVLMFSFNYCTYIFFLARSETNESNKYKIPRKVFISSKTKRRYLQNLIKFVFGPLTKFSFIFIVFMIKYVCVCVQVGTPRSKNNVVC